MRVKTIFDKKWKEVTAFPSDVNGYATIAYRDINNNSQCYVRAQVEKIEMNKHEEDEIQKEFEAFTEKYYK